MRLIGIQILNLKRMKNIILEFGLISIIIQQP